jgi:hypothetical protein
MPVPPAAARPRDMIAGATLWDMNARSWISADLSLDTDG